MKKYFTLLFGTLFASLVHAQTLVHSATSDDHMTCITAGVDKKYTISAGYTDGFSFADQDIVINRMDLAGNVIWSKRINHVGIDAPQDLLTTSDSNFVLVGSLGKTGGSDLFVMKFDTLGNILWQKLYVGSSESVAYEVVEKQYNGAKNVYMLVGSQTTISADKDIVYMIFNEDGSVEIANSRGTSGNEEAYGLAVKNASEDPILVGYTDFYGTKDLIYNEMDFDGSSFSVTSYDGGGDEYGQGVITAASYIIFGTNTNSFSTGNNWDMLFSRVQGTTMSNRRFDFGSDDKLNKLVSYGGNGVGINGYVTNIGTNKREGFHSWLDLTFNNEGGVFFRSCDANHEYYDEAIMNNFSFATKNTLLASTDYLDGSSDFVFENQTCLTENNNDQSMIFNVNWLSVNDRSSDFTNKGIQSTDIRDTSLVFEDYALALESFCSAEGECNITLDLSPEDTLVICKNTPLTVVLESCETILWSPENISVGINGLTTPSATLIKTGWVKATKSKGTCSVTDSVFVNAIYDGTITFEEPLIGNTNYCLDQTTKIFNTSKVETKTWTISVPGKGVLATFNNVDTISYTFADSLVHTIRLNLGDTRCTSGFSTTKTVSIIPLKSEETKSLVFCNDPSTISASSNGNPNIKYLWNTGEITKTINTSMAGEYFVTKTWAGTNCSYTDTFNISFPNLDTVAISSSLRARCDKDTLKISLPASAKSSNWTLTNLTNSAIQNLGDSLDLTLILQGGFFRIQNNWTSGCNTSKSYTKDIDVFLIPEFSLVDTAVCGVSPILDPKITSFMTWGTNWSTGETTKTITANASGKYILTTTNGPCVYKDSSVVTIRNSSATITNPIIEGTKQMCLGDTAKFYVPNIGDSVRWVVSSSGLSYLRDTIRFVPVLSGTFSVFAYPTEKCEFNGRASTTYKVSSAQVAPDIKDTSSCNIQSITYSLPSGMDFYRWSDGSTESITTITKTGQYFVEYGNGSCSIIDSFFVELAESTSASYSASKRSNIWIFGTNAGLDFNFDPPIPFTKGVINTSEGCSTICDEYGNLLFYTDGSKVYNRNFVTMPNGTGLLGYTSSTHSSIIVPHPGNSNLYYIFTTNGMENIENKIGFNYSIVDVSLNNGFGDVIVKNKKLFDYSTEKVAAVESSDGQSIWVVAHESTSVLDDGSNRFFVYNVGVNGLDTIPVISSVGHFIGDFKETNWGQMKISPNGKKIAVGIGDIGLEVFDFDANTGKISNPWFVDHEGGRVYGVEFSPNSEYVFFGGFAHSFFDQYRVAGINSENDFKNSKYRHFTRSNVRGMQLAPNGKIYVIIGYTDNDVSVINNPNGFGSEIDLNQSIINISGKNGWTFPSVNTSYSRPKQPFDINFFNACVKDEVKFSTNSIYQNIVWDFGDSKSETGKEVYHKYDAPGLYTVKAKYNAGCDEFSKVIEVSSPASSTVKDTISLCANNTTLDANNPLDKVFWYKFNSNVLIDSTQNIHVNNSGDYIAKIKHENCLDTSYFNVFLEKEPELGIDTVVYNCFEDGNIFLELGSDPKSYTWLESNQTNTPLFVSQAGRYLVEVIGDSLCKQTKGINVVDQCKGIVFMPNAFTPNKDNLNDEFVPFTKFLTKYELRIFNQWGEMVFASTDENKHWDGTYKGIEALEGIYTYVLNYSYLYKNQEFSEEEKGYISLIK